MDYFDPNGQSISVFDVCEAYRLLEANYNVGGWLRERPSNQRRRESIGCQLARLNYSSGSRIVELWASAEDVAEELKFASDDEGVRYVYFKKVLEWGLPIDEDDRAVIDRIFTIDAIERWRPDYFPVRPWRAVLRPDHEWWAQDIPAWMVVRPLELERSRQIHLNREGQPAYFDSYESATQKAKSLTEEMHASTQGTGAQGATITGS
ncbi:hypothetical protein H4CHR_02916 [Variovorax sp. PBS-H4]|uniref:hypothetical protein n=1 Tax=Variovorax sp. PBS-H4 TaxID=434008 RepID=UPI0013189D18|nr:hypothetical protein [Variovorax sp. PBS-H4]VTU31974.1 hypothetical protein H4CHR_02916 [Variovorax sp. PBS-H4]